MNQPLCAVRGPSLLTALSTCMFPPRKAHWSTPERFAKLLLFTLRALLPPDSMSCMSPVYPVPSPGCELSVARATGSLGPTLTQTCCMNSRKSRWAGSPCSPPLGGDGWVWPQAPSQVTLLPVLSGLDPSSEMAEVVIALFCLLPKEGTCLLTHVEARSRLQLLFRVHNKEEFKKTISDGLKSLALTLLLA